MMRYCGVGYVPRSPTPSDRLSHSDLFSGIRDVLSAIACAMDWANSGFSSPTHRYSPPTTSLNMNA